ncbi:beige protein-like 1 [Malassezia nana]|uniref:Beige protein homolog 1 n=1 Tax=Malassezia nana TaxID=180528 RepID=A0AAF0EQY2_9BASI|nr:beige protein-like 1 [Malassezia nana]
MARVLSGGRDALLDTPLACTQERDSEQAVHELLLQSQLRSPLLYSSEEGSWAASASASPPAPSDRDGPTFMDLLAEIHDTSAENYEALLLLASRTHALLTEPKGQVDAHFGEQGGFLIVAQLLAAVQRGRDLTDKSACTSLSRLLLCTLQILADAITSSRDHLQSFERLLGWDSLVSTLVSAVPPSMPSRTIAMLWGLALGQVATGLQQFRLVSEAVQAESPPPALPPPLSIVHPLAVSAAVSLAEEPHVKSSVRKSTYTLLHAVLLAHERNISVLSRTRVPSLLLRAWLDGRREAPESNVLRLLWQDGLQRAEDARTLFTHLVRTPSLDDENDTLRLLHEIAATSHRSASLTMEVDAHGAAGLHIPALPRPFPSDDVSSKGFSLVLWLQIGPTTAQQGCLDVFRIESAPSRPLRLLYELASCTLAYDPGGVTSERWSLSRTHLMPGQWHSVVLTHARSMPRVASHVHVYLDGKRACTLLVPWPGAMPHPATVWLGGAPIAGEARASWSLASALLMDGLVPPSVPALLHELAPSYTGNLQAPLARFLPYAGLARMRARLSELAVASTPRGQSHAYRALKNALYMAAADLFPLHRIYLHIQAGHTRRSGTCVCIPNQALAPKSARMNHALVVGVPTVRIPRTLDDAVWTLGGCTVLLRLVERASSPVTLEASLSFFLRLVSCSWRLAEDAERSQAFGIVGMLLRAKAPWITVSVLEALVEAAAPAGSLSNVPLYRAVLLDADLWAHTSATVQRAYAQHFATCLPRTRSLSEAPLIPCLIHYAMRAVHVPVPVLDEAMRAALESHLPELSLQSLVLFLVRQLGQVAPSAASLGAGCVRTDEMLYAPPMEARHELVPASPTQDARGQALSRAWLATLHRVLSKSDARIQRAAQVLSPKWLLVLLRPGLSPENATPVLSFVQQLLLAAPAFGHAFVRLGGFRVLEATLPTLWHVPCVFPCLWTLFLGPRKRAASLYATFATELGSLLFPQALRVIAQCISAGLHACRTLPRRRRASLPLCPPDTAGLLPLADSVSLLVHLACEPPVYHLLMLAPTLVCLLRATAPRYMEAPCGEPVATLCADLTHMLARCMADRTLESHTLTLLHNMHGAMPTPDPLLQSRLCVGLYIPLLAHLQQRLASQPLPRVSLELVADALELMSNESMRDALLQQRIFEFAELLLQAPSAALSPRARSQAAVGLERNLLHALADPSSVPDALRFCAHAGNLVLTKLADDTFVRVVFYHAHQHASDPHAASCLARLQTVWPSLDDADVASCADAWASILGAQRSFLRRLAGAHLRLRLPLPSPRAQAVLGVHRRLDAWYEVLQKQQARRAANYAQDTQEDVAHLVRMWADLVDKVPITASSARTWQLDPTEGPCRARIQLYSVPERNAPALVQSPPAPSAPLSRSEQDAVPLPEEFDMGAAPQDETAPPSASGVPAPEEARALSAPAEDTQDRIRWISRMLHRGDAVEGILNTSCVVGVDVQAHLLILGTRHLYLLSDYFYRPHGEIVHVSEAPSEEQDTLILAAGVTQVADTNEPLRVWRWSQLKLYLHRAWLHRRTALECFFADGRSCLLVLPSQEQLAHLTDQIRVKSPQAHAASEELRESVTDGAVASSRLQLRRTIGRATAAWRERRLSNAEYIMTLNTLAGRTMNDLTQFPVFPWVLADYDSTELDWQRASTFRKLDLPMGAQQPARRADFIARYEQLCQVHMEPFHYGTHYSTATSVCGFLVRVQPFADILHGLQGGTFDLPDRVFASVRDAWLSASERSGADVRELVPEFYFLPEMFMNANHFEFGTTQAGKKIDDVELPPWAHGDPFLFVQKHREALESDFVSAHLHEWIDLIFGYKARGSEAVASTNVFHPMSYSHAVDLEDIDSAIERQAAAQVVHNFGQTPAQLFTRPHPPRLPAAPVAPWHAEADLLQYPELLLQSRGPVVQVAGAVYRIGGPPGALYASTRERVLLPEAPWTLSYGYEDNSVRFSTMEGKLVAMLEHAAVGRVTCLEVLRDQVLLGSDDGMVHIYSLQLPMPHMDMCAALSGHTAAVLCMAVSSSWSVAVTGSQDDTVLVWDLNRHRLVRQLEGPDQPVEHVAIDEKKGWVAATAGTSVWIWSINGVLLVQQSTRSATSHPVTSLSWVARDVHVGKLGVLATGHRDLVVLWDVVSQHERPKAPRWRLSRLSMLVMREQEGVAITALRDSSSSLLSVGDQYGRLYTWNLPGSAIPLDLSEEECHVCQRGFGFLDKKRTCQGCGGSVCHRCSSAYAGGQLRLCFRCAGFLGSRGMSL